MEKVENEAEKEKLINLGRFVNFLKRFEENLSNYQRVSIDSYLFYKEVEIASIPYRRLKDKNLHIISPKTKKDMGTLKEYIVERSKALLGIDIVFDF